MSVNSSATTVSSSGDFAIVNITPTQNTQELTTTGNTLVALLELTMLTLFIIIVLNGIYESVGGVKIYGTRRNREGNTNGS